MSTPPRARAPEVDSGPYLDRLIELKVFGRKPVTEAPCYSTDDLGVRADPLARHLPRRAAALDGDSGERRLDVLLAPTLRKSRPRDNGHAIQKLLAAIQ